MKKVLLVFILFTVVAVFPQKTYAQIVINEVSSASDPEWVEIYNVSSDSASLKGYSINFGTDSQNKFFCDEENINQNSYKIISLTSHWLADSGDVVTLKNGDDVVDTIGYGLGHTLGKPSSTGSISRSPDGGANWVLITASTQQGDQISFDCPTPIPSPTSTPTITPSPTPTSTPVPTPTKTPTPIPTKLPTQSPTLLKESPTPEVLGEETSEPNQLLIPSPTPTLSNQKKDGTPILAFVLIGAGMISIIVSFYLSFIKIKKPNIKNTI